MRCNRQFSHSKKAIRTTFLCNSTRKGSIELRQGFYNYCAHSKILQNVQEYRSIKIGVADSIKSALFLRSQHLALKNTLHVHLQKSIYTARSVQAIILKVT